MYLYLYIYIYLIYTTISTCQLTSPGSLVGGIYGVEKDLVDLGPGTSRPRPESALMEKFLGNLGSTMSCPYAPCMEYESLHLPQKSTSYVGKYSIHGASGLTN